MDNYPCQRDLTPSALLELASDYLASQDYGPAIFYSTFVLGVPEFDSEACVLVSLARIIQDDARRAMDEDLAARINGSGVRMTPKNHSILMEEWSPHWDRYVSLLRKFGADY